MKIPTSSSILLATMAISSSSSCLAAPAGDPNQDIMTASTSTSQMSSIPSASAAPPHRGERIVEEGSNVLIDRAGHLSYLETRVDPDSDVGAAMQVIHGVPMVGPPMAKVVSQMLAAQGSPGVQSANVSGSSQGIDSQDMAALQASAQEVSRTLNATLPLPVPQPIQNVGGASPVSGALSEGDDPNSDAGPSNSVSSAAAGPSQAVQDVDGQSSAAASSTAYSSASAAPSSPPMPGNPPNTPALALPGNSGGLPVNV